MQVGKLFNCVCPEKHQGLQKAWDRKQGPVLLGNAMIILLKTFFKCFKYMNVSLNKESAKVRSDIFGGKMSLIVHELQLKLSTAKGRPSNTMFYWTWSCHAYSGFIFCMSIRWRLCELCELWSRFSSSTSLYLDAFVLTTEKHLHSMMLPPPCFTAGMILAR